MDYTFDAVIIGTGQAGYWLARSLSEAGWDVALVERKHLGGYCVNAGCVPTRALAASAKAAYMISHSPELGILPGRAPRVDLKLVKTRKDEIVDELRSITAAGIMNRDGCKLIFGTACFEAADRIRVGNDVLCSNSVFVNVGARPLIPDFAFQSKVKYLTSTTILDLELVPDHLVIIGGSYVGVEFAQIYRRFGSRVTIVEQHDRLFRGQEDQDVSAAIRQALQAEGVQFVLGTECTGLSQRGETIDVHLRGASGSGDLNGSHVLLAVGRTPNTDDLGADHASLVLTKGGFIEVDEQLRTAVEGIWALGSCNGRTGIGHASHNDFEIVAANIIAGDPRRVTDRISAHAVSIDPPFARVGMNEEEVLRKGLTARVGVLPMRKVVTALEKSETLGFVKILVDSKTEQLLGASVFGVGGDEVVHSILTAMYAKQPASLIRRSVFIHPTVSEIIPEILRNLQPLQHGSAFR